MAIDVDRARAETPGCAHVAHFNSAGASLMPVPVIEAVIDHTRLEAEIGGYEAAGERELLWESTYDAIGELINCNRDEIAIVENATRAWDMAFYALRFRPGDRILTAKAEYASNFLAYLQAAARYGVEIDVIPNDDAGQLSVQALENMIDDRVRLISITHVPTNGGLVNPAAAVGRVANRAGVPYILDACQSAGQIPLDVEEIGCDVLTATGRKFLRGPRGTGFLYVRRDLIRELEPPFVDLRAARWDTDGAFTVRDDARRFESWETNYATKIGLGAAVRYALGWGIDEIQTANHGLAESLRTALGTIPRVEVLDLGEERCAIVSFAVAGADPRDVHATLGAAGINVSVSVIEDTRLDMSDRGYEHWLRASVHYFNTEHEVERLAQAVYEIAAPPVRRRA